jgi:LysM repeat protein
MLHGAMLRRGLAVVGIVAFLGTAAAAETRPKRGAARVHRVERGQVLGTIAKQYGVSVRQLCAANRIPTTGLIRVGQSLVIPVSEERSSADHAARLLPRKPPPGASWAEYMKPAWRRGYVTLAGHGKRWSGYVIGPDEDVLPLAQQKVSRALASWRTGAYIEIDERLIRLLAHVSDVFGGRTIRIVSGYRELSYARHSKHQLGRALDFSIPGVPNEVLRDFLRTLPDVGVGYYPNSTHVHLDVREKNGYWVDHSGPGQKPRYGREPIASRSGR